MADYIAKVAPFINKEFYVSARAGQYPSGGYHSGCDLSTGTGTRGETLYSICNGTVIDKGYQANGYGNFIIIKDNDSEWAFLFGHMADPALLDIGDSIKIGQAFGIEGSTGNSTGLHVHIDMQNYIKNGNKWIYNARDPSLWEVVYFPAPIYMGFPNIQGIWVIYEGGYIPDPPEPFPTDTKNWWWIRKNKKIRLTY